MLLVKWSPILSTLEVLTVSVITILAYIYWKQRYWKRLNVPYLEPAFPLGHYQGLGKSKDSLGNHFRGLYIRIRQRNLRYCGIYLLSSPVLYVVDPDLLKSVLTTDFQYFTDRAVYFNEKDDPLEANLFTIDGPKWRKLRPKLTPTFSSGKMKMMFQTLVDCARPLIETLDEHYNETHQPVNIKDMCIRFTTDVIGSCAFGLECNSFKQDGSPFSFYGKQVFERTPTRFVSYMFAKSFPKLAVSLGITDLPKDVSDFFWNMVRSTVDYRERNNVSRDDFLQLLMELHRKEGDADGLTMNELAAQCLVFFAAGFDTSSTTMTFAMYELARRPEIQNKVRLEIEEVLERNDGQLSYDAINEMKYLGQVIDGMIVRFFTAPDLILNVDNKKSAVSSQYSTDETLRRYPPGPYVLRNCVKDYKFSDVDLVVKKGVKVVVPIMGLHLDPEYHPDPLKFDPDRFSDENKFRIRPYTYLPFGEGPRNCIGLRFAYMVTKVGLISFIRNYKFTVNQRTTEPLKMNTMTIVQSVEGDIWLDMEKMEQ